ncbi:fumarylacetoacetate hydrolase family protein [Acidothermaceae bacterium B102]|nr:fumarylacetoacetate hydrolase family protein [Acidothermaceae bacterium B102]
MRLATLRIAGATRAARIEDDGAVLLDAVDVSEILATQGGLAAAAHGQGQRLALDDLDYATLLPRPEKVLCVGLNYAKHITEMGRELPEFPTLFAKYPRALIGAYDEIALPPESDAIDWEAELGVVIGTTVRRADVDQAREAIAGYTVANDVTARDWQYRTTQWLQGKNFEGTTPVGPWLVTTDGDPHWPISCQVDGETVQESNTADLVFDPVSLVQYISSLITLVPGDLIITGTPGGVGHARKPPRYLHDGSVLTTTIDGVGQCRNVCHDEKPACRAEK